MAEEPQDVRKRKGSALRARLGLHAHSRQCIRIGVSDWGLGVEGLKFRYLLFAIDLKGFQNKHQALIPNPQNPRPGAIRDRIGE